MNPITVDELASGFFKEDSTERTVNNLLAPNVASEIDMVSYLTCMPTVARDAIAVEAWVLRYFVDRTLLGIDTPLQPAVCLAGQDLAEKPIGGFLWFLIVERGWERKYARHLVRLVTCARYIRMLERMRDGDGRRDERGDNFDQTEEILAHIDLEFFASSAGQGDGNLDQGDDNLDQSNDLLDELDLEFLAGADGEN